MHDLARMQQCASVNFKKWICTSKIWICAFVILVFAFWNLSGVTEYSFATGIRTTPWLLPHFLYMPTMVIVYGFVTIAFFSDAPFRDPFSSFMRIRVGRKIWIQGQLLYIFEASAVYTLYYLLVTILMVLPRIYLVNDWGTLLERLAFDIFAPNEYGISMSGIVFSSEIIESCKPVSAMALSLLMLWLVSSWIGMLIFVLQILFKRGIGIVVAGFFVFFSYFSNIVGWIMMGSRIFFFSPVNWVCIAYLDVGGQGQMPDILYAVCVLIASMICFGLLGVDVYCATDE